MSDKTSNEQELSRNEVADHLQELARDIEGAPEEVRPAPVAGPFWKIRCLGLQNEQH